MSRYFTYFFFWLILFAATASSAEPYKLALSAPLSGGGAGWGKDMLNILNFANEKLADGKYHFIVEDDRCDMKTALSIAKKLTSVDRIPMIFPQGHDPALSPLN